MRVVIADDSVLLRAGLARLLEDAGFEVVGQAADAEDLLRKVRAHKPDIAVTDIRMPPTQTDEGLRAAQLIRSELPAIGVMVLSQFLDEGYALELLQGSTEGVGYLLKDRVADVDAFVDALRRVAARVPERVDVGDAVLVQVADALRAALQQLQRVALVEELREHHHADRRQLAADQLCRPQPLVGLRRRHADVRDGDVGLVRADLAQQVLGVRRLADDLEAGVLEQAGETRPQQDRVVGDHHAHTRSLASCGDRDELASLR